MKPTAELEHFLYHTSHDLIGSLNENAQPLWGMMNATQMLAHLSVAVKASNGMLTAPFTSDPAMAEKLRRISLFSNRALPRDFNNPVLKMVPQSAEASSHEQGKDILKENLLLFQNEFEGKDVSYTHMHNIFGPLNYEAWVVFHYKHFHHHLAQFGIIPYVEKFEW